MKFKIFDYDNNISWVEDDTRSVADIEAIFIHVLSGDEVGMVLFKDGETLQFDASTLRVQAHEDGMYCVISDKIQEWIDYDPEVGPFESKAYERLYKFG